MHLHFLLLFARVNAKLYEEIHALMLEAINSCRVGKKPHFKPRKLQMTRKEEMFTSQIWNYHENLDRILGLLCVCCPTTVSITPAGRNGDLPHKVLRRYKKHN